MDLGEGPGGPACPLFWVKEEKITEERKAGRASKTTSPPLAQGLDPPLNYNYKILYVKCIARQVSHIPKVLDIPDYM